MTTALICNTSAGLIRRHDLFGNAPAGYGYTLERDPGSTLLHLTETDFRDGMTIDGKPVNLSRLVAFAGGWRTV